jgi:chromosomal replication initiator protein
MELLKDIAIPQYEQFSPAVSTTRQVEDCKENWKLFLNELSTKINKISFASWIQPLKPVEFNEKSVVIAVKNEFSRKLVNQNYGEKIYQTAKEVLAAAPCLRIIVDKNYSDNNEYRAQDITPELKIKQASFAEVNTQLTQRVSYNQVSNKDNLNSKYALDNFHEYAGNSAALAFAKALLQNDYGISYNSLFVQAGSGLGKTHFMHAIGNYAKQSKPDLKVRYVQALDFVNEFILAIKKKETASFQSKYKRLDFLLIDNIENFENKKATQAELTALFDYLVSKDRKILFTSSKPINELKKLEQAFYSRLAGSLVADIKMPNPAQMCELLFAKLKFNKLNLEARLAKRIASQKYDSIRELDGAILKLNAASKISKLDLDEDTISNMFGAVHMDERQLGLSVSQINSVVAEHFNLDPEALIGRSRKHNLCQARHLAVFLSHEMLELSYQRIGDFFSGRKHSSIIYSIKTIKSQLNSKLSKANSLKLHLNDIRLKLRG